MCLPSVVVLVVLVGVAAGEELVLVLVVYYLIILLKAHSRNLRHNSIEHRRLFSLFFFFRGRMDFFSRVRGFFLSYTRA
jgi:hypothetical protein